MPFDWRSTAKAALATFAFAALTFTLLVLAVIAVLLWSFLQPAHARDNGQWANSPANVRHWFETLMQPDNPYTSCCGEADAFEADQFEIEGDHYVAIVTDGRGILPTGTRIPVPNIKMKWDSGNPTGHGIIFLGVGTEGDPLVYCYVTPGGV